MKIAKLFRHGFRCAGIAFFLFPVVVAGTPLMMFVDWVCYDEDDEWDHTVGKYWSTLSAYRDVITAFGKSWNKMSEALDNR